ncbi:MAG: hypothetical protein ACLGHN_11795 [Bacteriovoracia bacterium]
MNFAKPILICDENESFRNLLRDMLVKNGFFHVVEATTPEEIIDTLRGKKEYFALIHSTVLTPELIGLLSQNNNFIIFADNTQNETISIAARLGVKHILSYPFHSRKLLEKINSLS